jgi:hypothetical protein
MMRAAVVDVSILSYCISISRGLGGKCKGALRQNVVHHVTTIQTKSWKDQDQTQKKGNRDIA